MTDPVDGHPRSDLSAYFDDQLGVEERLATDRHLASCEDCRAELAALRSLAEAVGSEHVPPVPSDLAARIGRRVDASTVARFPNRRFFVPATIAATLGAIGLLVAIQWREGHLGAPAAPAAQAPQEQNRSADVSTRSSATAAPVTTEDTLAARQARPEAKEAAGSELADKDAKRADAPADEERLKQKKDERAEGALDGGGAAAPVDDRRERDFKAVLNEQAAAPPAPAAAAKSAVISSCAERWSDSGVRGSWNVTDVDTAEKQLGRMAHAVAGIGLWHGVADGRPYVVVVPRERFEEVFYALRARGVTGLDEPQTLPREPTAWGSPSRLRAQLRQSLVGLDDPERCVGIGGVAQRRRQRLSLDVRGARAPLLSLFAAKPSAKANRFGG